MIDVGDVSGHQIRVSGMQRAWPKNPPVFNGVPVKEERLCAISDYIDINGPSWGYSHYILESGDEIFPIRRHEPDHRESRWIKEEHIYSVLTVTEGTGEFRGIRVPRGIRPFRSQRGFE